MMGIVTSGLPLTGSVSLAWAGGLALKASALLALAGLLAVVVARSSAALRHLLWSLAIVGVLVLPAVPVAVPWSLDVLPGPEAFAGLPPAVATGAVVDGPGPETPRASAGGASTDATTPARQLRESPWTTPNGPGAGASDPLVEVASGPAAGAPGAPATALPFETLALLTWAAVAFLVSLHHLAGRLALGRITRGAQPVEDPEVVRELRRAARSAGVSRRVRLLRSDRARVPMTWGVRRPVVLLPRGSRQWSADRIRLVLDHELAHVRRLDALTDVLGRLACSLHWFNPLVWWAAARLRAESERASDDMVLRGGARASDYAGHLLELVTHLGPRRAPAGALPLAQKSQFEGRLLAILDPTRERSGIRLGSAVSTGAVLAMAVVALGSIAPARAAATEAGGEGHRIESADPVVHGSSAASAPAPETPGDEPATTPRQRAGADLQDRSERSGEIAADEPGEATDRRKDPSAAEAGQALDTTSVRALTRALQADDDPEVRRTAAWALGQIEDRAATPSLVRALRDDGSPEVRRMVVWALGQIEDPAAAPALGDALGDEDVEVRRTALWALGQIESPEAVGPLSRALSDGDAEVRKTAAWALGQIESPEAVGPLAGAVDDEDPEVRAQVVWALGQIESAEAVAPLGRALGDPEAKVRRQAAWALGQIESASAVTALARTLREDSDAEVRRQAAWALGQIEADAAVPALAAALGDSDVEVARTAAWALGQVEPASAPNELIEAARTGSGRLRATALWALVQIEDPAAVPALVEALRDDDPEIRTTALRGLAEVRTEAAVQAIAELLQDPDPEVRSAAARALAGRGGGWNNPNPNPNPDPRPDPRPRPNGG